MHLTPNVLDLRGQPLALGDRVTAYEQRFKEIETDDSGDIPVVILDTSKPLPTVDVPLLHGIVAWCGVSLALVVVVEQMLVEWEIVPAAVRLGDYSWERCPLSKILYLKPGQTLDSVPLRERAEAELILDSNGNVLKLRRPFAGFTNVHTLPEVLLNPERLRYYFPACPVCGGELKLDVKMDASFHRSRVDAICVEPNCTWRSPYHGI